MDTRTVPPPELLFPLAPASGPIEAEARAQLLKRRGQTWHSALSSLREAAVPSDHDMDLDSRGARDDAAGARLAETAGAATHIDEGLLLDVLSQLHAGRLPEGCGQLCALTDTLIRDNCSAAALVCLDILLDSLKGWEPDDYTNSENMIFLDMVRRALGNCLYLTTCSEAVPPLSAKAFSLAERLGNRRAFIQLRMMQICLHFTVGGMLSEDPHTALESVIGEINMLGDKDILLGTAHGISLRHLTLGEFAESIACLRDNPPVGSDEVKYYGWISLSIGVASACALGRFGSAVGAALHALHLHRRANRQFPMRRAAIFAAAVLLSAGLPDAAMEIAGDAVTDCAPDTESGLMVAGRAFLAFYHFRKGNLPASHAMLGECRRLAELYRLKHHFEWHPEVYDMLWAYREHGLPDIPGIELEWELNKALGSRSPYVQGTALRVQARQFLKQRGGYKQALTLIEGSRFRLKRCEAPVAYARSGLVLAACLKEAGASAEAESVYAESCAVLGKYRQYDCPEDPPRPADDAEEREACAALCVKRFMEIPNRLLFAERLQRYTDIMCDTLNLERAALLAVGDNRSFTCLAAGNFSLSEANGMALIHVERISKCLRNGSSGIWLVPSGACLCMPLTLPDGRSYAFFAHCAYLIHAVTEHDPSYFEPARQVLEEEFRLACRMHSGIDTEEQEEDKQVCPVTEHPRQSEKPAYGPSMRATLELADKAAPTPAAVLLLGETGVGKEELARRIHQNSGRSGPFIVVNLAAIPDQLFASELFGHEKGAFTGAVQQKTGLLELADKGTLFIDEVGDIPPNLQVRLLRVLQDKKFSRVGGTRLLTSDFRLISATNQNLQAKIKENAFREDLYYRIAVVSLTILPLRERPDDIKRLALLFHGRYSAYYRRDVPPLTPQELEELAVCPWPGNIRQLKSLIERGVILHDPQKSPHFLQERPEAPLEPPKSEHAEESPPPRQDTQFRCDDLPTMHELQRRYIRHALALTRGKIRGPNGALAILDMKQSSFYKKIKEYGLDKTSLLYGRK
ncbi:MAG: sigma 54-interacting transcriptional regulator [Desulfovibrio sp.]|nr:sigma 54-interacting transcriptional regulator [Desulfovibrio sp.]